MSKISILKSLLGTRNKFFNIFYETLMKYTTYSKSRNKAVEPEVHGGRCTPS
jgi:hypothetical protein